MLLLHQSLWVHMSIVHVDLEGLIFLVFSNSLTLFLSPLPTGSLSSGGRDLLETSHLGLSSPNSFTFHIMSGLCLCSHLLGPINQQLSLDVTQSQHWNFCLVTSDGQLGSISLIIWFHLDYLHRCIQFLEVSTVLGFYTAPQIPFTLNYLSLHSLPQYFLPSPSPFGPPNLVSVFPLHP